jgi:hypothetical protein
MITGMPAILLSGERTSALLGGAAAPRSRHGSFFAWLHGQPRLARFV